MPWRIVRLVAGVGLFALASCLGDPAGPTGLHVEALHDSLLVGHPGQPLNRPIQLVVRDGEGHALAGASVTWTVRGAGASVAQSSSETDHAGLAQAYWTLGTSASETQILSISASTIGSSGSLQLVAESRPTIVAKLTLDNDTLSVALGSVMTARPLATDPYRNTFVPDTVRYVTLDSSIAVVDAAGNVHPRRRGWGRFVVQSGSAADTGFVHVIQSVARITLSTDTVRLHSLNQVATARVTLIDDHGLIVADSSPAIADSVAVAAAGLDGDTLRVVSRSVGAGAIGLAVGGVQASLGVVVNQLVSVVVLSDSSRVFDALSDTAVLTATASDSLGSVVPTAHITFGVDDSNVVAVSQGGVIRSRGNGVTTVHATATNGVGANAAMTVSQKVSRIAVSKDTILLQSLQATAPSGAVPVDRLGSSVSGATLRYSTSDSSVASVTPGGVIRALSNGISQVVITSGGDTGVLVARVQQRPARVLLVNDTLRFVALGETQQVGAIAVDSLGFQVSGPVLGLNVLDPTVAQQVDSQTVKSMGNGNTLLRFTVAGLPAQIPVVVSQVPASIEASAAWQTRILSTPAGAPVPISCSVRDRNGISMTVSPQVQSPRGLVSGVGCAGTVAFHSGVDTLTVSYGALSTEVPLTLAVAPQVNGPTGSFATLDSFPSDGPQPWAPTLRTRADGTIELYFAVYSAKQDSTGYTRANLHRYVSHDGGATFQYDGVALQHDTAICDPQGQGIENVVVLPRSDGPGYRMLFAAGSNTCYGWEVFSAVSTDGITWTKEPGVRLGNGNTGPKGGGSPYPPYPVGEGMYAYQVGSEWRLLVGTQAHVTPPVNKWQIAEWRSTDEISWTYQGVILGTSQMPAAGQGSVYSPTVAAIAPGLWRMFFTADNRGSSSATSSVWSAVSTDLESWQVEGPVLGASGSNLYYATLAAGRLVYVRQDAGGSLRVGTSTVVMP